MVGQKDRIRILAEERTRILQRHPVDAAPQCGQQNERRGTGENPALYKGAQLC